MNNLGIRERIQEYEPPPKELGEWNVAVGEVETLRLRTARSGLSAISLAGVPAMIPNRSLYLSDWDVVKVCGALEGWR